jgi:outer membrane protein, heavy metal efflux system
VDAEGRRRRRVRFFRAAYILLAIARSSGAEQALDLPSYLAEVRDRNPVIQSARARVAALERREWPARSWDDPFIAIGPDGLSEGAWRAEMVRYQVSQSIPFPGKRGARGEAAAERAGSAGADAATLERQLVVTATQTFYRLLFAQRSLELNRELTELVADAEASGKARYRAGDAAHHQWLLAKAELGVLATERVRLEGDATGLQGEINELRNRRVDTPLGSLTADLPSASTPLEEPSPGESPESHSLDALIRAAEADRRSAALAPLPDVVVQGMMDDPRHGMEERSYGVMFGVTVPLFWPLKQRELLAAAERERDAAVAEKEALENRLAAELARARAELTTSRRALELYEREIAPATEMALESARSGFAVGRVALTDLVAVARVRREQTLEQFASQIDLALARLRIEELLSTPAVMRLAPETPTLFGTGMGGPMRAGAMRAPLAGPTAIRLGSGMGLGAARGKAGGGDAADSDSGMRGM